MKKTPIELMRLAILEACKGGRLTKPNPRVGAALESKDGRVVLGHHQKAGEAHAEIQVLRECERLGVSTEGSQIAVTLEPCAHFGKTGPCADALIAAKVAKVYVGTRDTHGKVSGSGIQKLRDAGVKVEESVLGRDCFEINREWLMSHRLLRPFVTIKMATSFDGRWTADNGESKWITGDLARQRGHELRARVDAIATSYSTIEKDNPKLTARCGNEVLKFQPKVFVLSARQSINLSSFQVFAQHPIHVNTKDGLVLSLTRMYREFETHDLLLEAGPRLTTAFLNEGLIDELWCFQAPVLLGGKGLGLGAMLGGALPGYSLQLLREEKLGSDRLFVFAPSN